MHVELQIQHNDLAPARIPEMLRSRFINRDMSVVDASRYFAGHTRLIGQVIDAYQTDEYLMFAMQDDLTTLRLIVEPEGARFKKVSQRVLNNARKALKGFHPKKVEATLYDDAFEIMHAEVGLGDQFKDAGVYLSVGTAVLTLVVFGYLAFKKDYGLWPIFVGAIPVFANGLVAALRVLSSRITRRLIWTS